MYAVKKTLKIVLLATITWLLGAYLVGAVGAQGRARGGEKPGRFEGSGRPGGPPAIDPEELERSWLLQADSVAAALKLDPVFTDQLANAYLDAREAFQDRTMQARSGDNRPKRDRFRRLRTEVFNEFKTRIGTFLSPSQVEKASKMLGGSIQADRGTSLLSDLVDDESRLHSAVAILLEHTGKSFAGPRRDMRRKGSGSQGPPRGGRKPRQNDRSGALFEELGKVLSPDELQEFRKEFRRFQGNGPRHGGGGSPRGPGPR